MSKENKEEMITMTIRLPKRIWDVVEDYRWGAHLTKSKAVQSALVCYIDNKINKQKK